NIRDELPGHRHPAAERLPLSDCPPKSGSQRLAYGHAQIPQNFIEITGSRSSKPSERVKSYKYGEVEGSGKSMRDA
ncbi:MAG: hypothetical protein OXU36_09990, partial [Candidatus Poribacteria bacterium]|nr:hypothetical protein [Candidatus Poribacteria bacterium]